MKLRIKEVAKLKGIGLQDLALKLGISRQALDARINGNSSAEKIQEIADALGCSVFEIIHSDQYAEHSYNEKGDWRGVIKK